MGCKTKTKTLGLINKASANHKFSMLYDKDETKPLGSALVNSRQPRRHFQSLLHCNVHSNININFHCNKKINQHNVSQNVLRKVSALLY